MDTGNVQAGEGGPWGEAHDGDQVGGQASDEGQLGRGHEEHQGLVGGGGSGAVGDQVGGQVQQGHSGLGQASDEGQVCEDPVDESSWSGNSPSQSSAPSTSSPTWSQQPGRSWWAGLDRHNMLMIFDNGQSSPENRRPSSPIFYGNQDHLYAPSFTGLRKGQSRDVASSSSTSTTPAKATEDPTRKRRLSRLIEEDETDETPTTPSPKKHLPIPSPASSFLLSDYETPEKQEGEDGDEAQEEEEGLVGNDSKDLESKLIDLPM